MFPLEERIKIEGIVTSCRDCIFAVYDGNTQTGCEWDRLEKFEQEGAEIVGQDDSFMKYFLVVGRFCNACRHRTWGEQHPATEWRQTVAKEFQVRCAFIIYADEHASREDVEFSLNSALNQGLVQPSEIVLLLKGHRVATPVYLGLIKGMDLKIPWQIRIIAPGEAADFQESLDIAVKNIKGSTYYSVVGAGLEWQSNYLDIFNNAVNFDMKRITAILPSGEGNALTMMVKLHDKLLGGSKEEWVVDKLTEAAKGEGTEHTIVTWEDLCELQG